MTHTLHLRLVELSVEPSAESNVELNAHEADLTDGVLEALPSEAETWEATIEDGQDRLHVVIHHDEKRRSDHLHPEQDDSPGHL